MSDNRFEIRPPSPDQAVAVLCLHRAAVMRLATDYPLEARDAWSGPITAGRVAEYYDNGAEETRLIALCSRSGRIAGFGAIVLQTGELRACYVHPDFTRYGVGRLLMQQLEQQARAAGVTDLWLEASLNARAFYLSCGWTAGKQGLHELRGGHQIPCVRMTKVI